MYYVLCPILCHLLLYELLDFFSAVSQHLTTFTVVCIGQQEEDTLYFQFFSYFKFLLAKLIDGYLTQVLIAI